MFKLFQRVIEKEIANNTFRPRNRALASRAFGKKDAPKKQCLIFFESRFPVFTNFVTHFIFLLRVTLLRLYYFRDTYSSCF